MLVTFEQLEAKLRKSLDPIQAEQEIDLASGVVAEWCNLVSLELLEDDEITLPGVYGNVLPLPGGPVVSVSAVTVDTTAVSDYWLVKNSLHRGRNIGGVHTPMLGDFETWGGPEVEVAVTYTHGLAAVPMGVQAVVLDMAARAWSNPSGARQQSIDGYAVTWPNGLLTPQNKDALRRYHRTSRTADIS